MTANVTHTSAKIYQFPVGGRRSAADRREHIQSTTELRPAAVTAEAFGGGWYHEAAIEESKRASEH